MTISQRIRNILSVSREARNDDRVLWLIYAQKAGVELTPTQIDKIKQMPSFETLRRTRQSIQASGVYPADRAVQIARKSKASKVRQTIPFMDSEDVERTIDGKIVLPWGQ